MAKPTLENDGSVSEDPCQNCGGRLMLRRMPSGGCFLGCSNYPKGCDFKMAPNSEEMAEREIAKEQRKLAREKKRMEADAKYAREQAEKKRLAGPPPTYCNNCFERLSGLEANAGLLAHRGC